MSATESTTDAACDCGPIPGAACGCCEDGGAFTPLEIYNRPGLSAVAYRVGTQPDFKRTMLDRLSPSDPASPLRQLKSRSDTDFSIALLDAWASVADVLSFYQERIVNESYLRTATERKSVLELGRLVGYELRPGVAASTYLAFTMEQAPAVALSGVPGLPALASTPLPVSGTPGVPTAITIPVGTRVLSVPGPGERPQTFETVELIEARPEWNHISERLTVPHPADANLNRLVLRGLDSNLKPGDRLLLVDASQRVANRVLKVQADAAAQTTTVWLENGHDPTIPNLPTAIGAIPAGPTPLTDDTVRSLLISSDWVQDDLLALAAVQKWPLADLQAMIDRLADPPTALSAYVFLTKAAIFGHNAPWYDSLDEKLTAPNGPYPDNWEARSLRSESDEGSLSDPNTWYVFLDNAYPTIVPSSPTARSWLMLEAPATPRFSVPTHQYVYAASSGKKGGAFKSLYSHSGWNQYFSAVNLQWQFATQKVFEIQEAADLSRTAFTLSSKVTRLRVDINDDFDDLTIRNTTAFAQSRPLNLGELPFSRPDQDNLLLDGAYLGLKPGQRVVLTGELADRRGVTASEVLELDTVHVVGGFTRLTFKHGPDNAYVPSTRWVNANVAFATHGEGCQEVLGGGDPTRAYQTFTLRQPPLTFTPAATPSGNQSTLQVWVDDLLWAERPMLYGAAASDRIYVTRFREDGSTDIVFGDGITGARPTSGQANIRAVYRRGIGAAGSVAAGELSTLITRPLGVKGVLNPLAATGGEDPESGELARRNASLTIITLDRVVSLSDYGDFARAFSGVTKALATWTWDGARRGVLVTVAGPQGKTVARTDALYVNLLRAMKDAGDPTVPLRLASFRPAPFRLAAAVLSDSDRDPDQVRAEVETTLRTMYGFDARSFGQPVTLSGIIALIQGVPGVTEVNVTRLYRSADAPGASPPPDQLIPDTPSAGEAVAGGTADVLGAELLLLDGAPLSELTVTRLPTSGSAAGGTP